MSDPRNPASEVEPGAILAGRYRVESQIGAGGMGVVVAARHLQLGSLVAIKYLPSSSLGDPEAVERFQREAWAAAQIKSPHVVRVSDIASLPSGAPFIVMEYLEGEDLAHVIARHERWSIAEVAELILQVCEAIAEAHAIGVVHRDLKPSNIFVTKNLEGHRVAKVLDFGISKLTRDEFALGLTTTRTSLGSPTYMSPEQMHSSKEVDGRTDIWALGVILYELLAGRTPFNGASLPELALQIATQPIQPLTAAGIAAPPGLERIVQRCLEKDRSKRFPDIAAFAHALTEFAPLTASLHATRAERVLRDSGSSSQSLPAQTPKAGSRASLREVKRAESERPGKARSSDRVRRKSSEPDATRAARGSGRAKARGSDRPVSEQLEREPERSERSSDKVPKRRDRDDPSGRVSTRSARASDAAPADQPAAGSAPIRVQADEPRARSHGRKRPRPGLLLTAAVAVAVLLLAAVAITAIVGSGPSTGARPGAESSRSVASGDAPQGATPPKNPNDSAK